MEFSSWLIPPLRFTSQVRWGSFKAARHPRWSYLVKRRSKPLAVHPRARTIASPIRRIGHLDGDDWRESSRAALLRPGAAQRLPSRARRESRVQRWTVGLSQFCVGPYSGVRFGHFWEPAHAGWSGSDG